MSNAYEKVREKAEEYNRKMAILDKEIPWREISLMFIFQERFPRDLTQYYNEAIRRGWIINEREKKGVLMAITVEYYTLHYEILGMLEHPDKWVKDTDHPNEHIEHIYKLIDMLDRYAKEEMEE